MLKPGSYLAKYDLRDGFWSVPVHADDRHNLCIRHPSSGRLLWASRLPFGFNRSPEFFCRVTESVAEIVRKRGAGMGFHVFCFVDDFCIVGDDLEATQRGCEILEATLSELWSCSGLLINGGVRVELSIFWGASSRTSQVTEALVYQRPGWLTPER